MKVVHYQRKPRAAGNYSIESVFALVRSRARAVTYELRVAPCESTGLWRRLAIAWDAARVRADAVHVTGDIHFAVLLRRRHGTVLTIHDVGFLARPPGLKRWLLAQFWLILPLKRAALVTTVSAFSQAEIQRLAGGAAPAATLRVVPVAVADAFVRQDKAFDAARPRILILGTAPNKNVERMAAALAGIPCVVALIGRPSATQRAAFAAAAVPLEVFVGLDEAAVVAQYAAADLVLFASTYEGFGLPIVEAQRVGRPVVAGDAASMPDVAGGAACLVDPFDTAAIRRGVERVIADRAYREDLVARGFLNAARFDAACIAAQYEALYAEVAAKAR